jgi:hypothetical protein
VMFVIGSYKVVSIIAWVEGSAAMIAGGRGIVVEGTDAIFAVSIYHGDAYSELPINVWDSHNAELCKTARGRIAPRRSFALLRMTDRKTL